MLIIVGSLTVVLCVLGGYAALGGKLGVLWQPFEVVIIVGAAIGAFITSNPKIVLVRTFGAIGQMFRGSRYDKESYLELLTLLYQVFRIAKTKGMLALEQHIENPEDSQLFQQFPKFYADHHAVVFLCDYLRLVALGSDNPHELGDLMEEEIETHHHEQMQIANAIQTMADGMPALGIVAAVLGVIKTMGSITEPPEILGKLIGGALVGTFLGVWIAYGFVGPFASALRGIYDAEVKYLQCIRSGILAHLSGYAPAISVEFARKTLLTDTRPSFQEVEEATAALPPS